MCFQFTLNQYNPGFIFRMNKDSQKRIIEINHALSGVHGQQLKAIAYKANESRKQLLKKLERKKKLSSVIYDQLYLYLEKFPQKKLGLHQQSFKKKKAKLFQSEEKSGYKAPKIVHTDFTGTLDNPKLNTRLKSIFMNPITMDEESFEQEKESSSY